MRLFAAGDSMLPFAASARLCLLPHCTLMHVVIQWHFPLADVLSSPGHSPKLPPSSEAAALPNEVQSTSFCRDAVKALGSLKSALMLCLVSQEGLADQ